MKPHPRWTLPAVGVVTLANTGGKREELFAQGYRRMDILVAQGDKQHDENIAELLLIGDRLIREGWILSSWHSTTGIPTPHEEAQVALDAISRVPQFITGHLLNAEDWYEGIARWKTSWYWNYFQDRSALPISVWPMGSDAPGFERDFDYLDCIARGCMVYPQQYQNQFPSLTIPNGDKNLDTAGVPIQNRGTSPGTYINDVAPSIPWDAYAADLKVVNRPVLLYAADLGGFDPVQAGKLVLPPEEEDMQPVGKNDGIAAMYNRLRDLDPGGTLLKKIDGKWQSISVLASVPLDQWKAYDKAQRKDQILKDDHDESIV